MNIIEKIVAKYEQYTTVPKIEIPQSLAIVLQVEPAENGLYYAEPDVCINIADCVKAIYTERGILAQNITLNRLINED